MTGQDLAFPDGFLWGTATAAYQIEGAPDVDGRSRSIWDTFAHTPGVVEDGSSGDVACDHYRRYREDVELMASLSLSAYRFSVSWPRVVPSGDGAVNAAGLDFYDRLVDTLLDHGITPMLTLYHWDLPQVLQDRGGWAERSTIDAFVSYASVVARRLADRVPLWITHNEPWVTAFRGYGTGALAPGVSDWKTAIQAAHNILVSHGRAVRELHAHGAEQVGISPNLTSLQAATDDENDVAATARADEYLNRWFLDPIFHGEYPERLWSRLADRGLVPAVKPSDMSDISTPIDFLGVNYYVSARIADDPEGEGPFGYRDVAFDGPKTPIGWPVTPEALPGLLEAVSERYQPSAIYITESGAAYEDPAPTDGVVPDPERVAFLRRHFAAAHYAIAAGVPLRGYFVWTLIDNFEWIWGFARRFGVVQLDRESQQRTIKESGRFLEQVARANAVPIS